MPVARQSLSPTADRGSDRPNRPALCSRRWRRERKEYEDTPPLENYPTLCERYNYYKIHFINLEQANASESGIGGVGCDCL